MDGWLNRRVTVSKERPTHSTRRKNTKKYTVCKCIKSLPLMYGSSQALKFFKYSDSMGCGGQMFLLLNRGRAPSSHSEPGIQPVIYLHTYIIHETFSLPSAVVTVLKTLSLAR
jgi:hypothetical protein